MSAGPAAAPMNPQFAPTRAAALARIAAVQPDAYARSRNALDGAVSHLSPYLTHGIVSPAEVLAGIAQRHAITHQHQFVYELGWRAYFRHQWLQRGAAILQGLHDGPMPAQKYSSELPADIRQGRTGVPVIDQAVRTLYGCGYLHNHARMWLASYVVHVRHVHWRAGADWLIAHLLDGDLGSNHLSWQWVAGTGSSKPYLFNADNVARYAPPQWHSGGTVLDTSYAALTRLAEGGQAAHGEPTGDGVDEPALRRAPPSGSISPPPPTAIDGRDVWLVHPWALGEVPGDLPEDCVCVGWWPAEYHQAWPWRDLRWHFAGSRMASLSAHSWHGTGAELAAAVSQARSVQTWANPHISALLPPAVLQRAEPPLFPAVDQPCQSFSQWWRRGMRGVQDMTDLPGFAALVLSGRPSVA